MLTSGVIIPYSIITLDCLFYSGASLFESVEPTSL
jgi:hypothetical protein